MDLAGQPRDLLTEVETLQMSLASSVPSHLYHATSPSTGPPCQEKVKT